MASADYFDIPEIDVFDSEVETLVISVYKATIAGIKDLDRRTRNEFPRGVDSNPEMQQERWWWDDQVQAMKWHAGNIGLVSLVILFEDWLAKRYQELFPNGTADEWHTRFEKLTEGLREGPLPKTELEDIVTARNSVIHQRGARTFEWNKKPRQVSERFLDFDEVSGRERVAVDESLLIDLASKMKAFVNFWHEQRRT